MDGSDVDALARSLAAGHARRGLTRLLGGLVLGVPLALLGRTEAEAKKKKRKKKKKQKEICNMKLIKLID